MVKRKHKQGKPRVWLAPDIRRVLRGTEKARPEEAHAHRLRLADVALRGGPGVRPDDLPPLPAALPPSAGRLPKPPATPSKPRPAKLAMPKPPVARRLPKPRTITLPPKPSAAPAKAKPARLTVPKPPKRGG